MQMKKYLTGTYETKLDDKRRVHLPKPIIDGIIKINGKEKILYLEFLEEKKKLRAYTIPYVEKRWKDLQDLQSYDEDNLEKMEKFGASLKKITFTGDGRLTLPQEFIEALNLEKDVPIAIKGAGSFITISKL